MVITGQVPTNVVGTDAFQESDMVGMMYPTTKQAVMIQKTDNLQEKFFNLAHIATAGRPGPVHIDLPKNVQLNSANLKDLDEVEPNREYFKVPHTTQAQYDKAAQLIDQAEKPVAFCGHGVIISQAEKEFERFVEKSNIPFTSTLHGLSALPADHPKSLGMMGMHGTVAANKAISQTDLIIAFGMRFDDRVTAKLSEYAKNAKVIHVEIDPSEIDKNVETSLAINADAKNALEKLNNRVTNKNRKDWFDYLDKQTQRWQDYIEPILKKGTGPNKGLLMKTIVHRMSELTKGKDNVVPDVGLNQMMAARFYNYQRTNSAFFSGGLGTMGCALPTAIGVKLARPDERVWVIAGDGGIQMNLQEFETLIEYDLDIKIMVFNNEVLGMVRQWQSLFFGKRYAQTDLVNPDFVKLAQAYDIPAQKVTEVEDIDDSIKWAIETDGPTLVEYSCDRDELIMPMIPAGATFDEMIETKKDIKS
jgi:acetolactate synthase-1/2/3 large subunit